MKRVVSSRIRAGFAGVVMLGLVFVMAATAAAEPPRKIVVFEETFVNQPAQLTLLANFGATIIKPLPLINGAAVYLPPQAERALLRVRRNIGVLRIDDDLIINATGKPRPPQPAEEIPWGIQRINAGSAWSVTEGPAVKVAVLDTGIDLDHPDLKDNIKGQVNAISPRKSGNDDNGHGTHVAGTIAAVNNDIGVVGVGPQIWLYAVKVLDRSGSGWLSDIIEGLDWCINNKIQVVNMSLGAPSDNLSFHTAIISAYNAGIVLVAAAGNNGPYGGVDYPGKYMETIAVSAVGQDSAENLYLASFSSTGPEVDLAAPGVNIKSTYNDGYYKLLNGTSMATPHVTGAAALVISTPYDPNGNGVWEPHEVVGKLKATAENLGLPSYQQGAGLVSIDLAIQ